MRTPATRQTYVHLLITAMALAACFLAEGTAQAAGTPAGTTIVCPVTVDYMLGVVPQPTLNASTSFVVDRLVNVTVTKNSDPSAAPSQPNVPMSFRVTNTGNAPQRYALQAVSRATNTWTMNNVRIYRDNNSSGSWDAGDTLYADAGTFGDLGFHSVGAGKAITTETRGAGSGITGLRIVW